MLMNEALMKLYRLATTRRRGLFAAPEIQPITMDVF
jgi:hypothetical protein